MMAKRRFSRFTGGLRVGADYFDRERAVVAGAPRGVVDRIADLAHPGIDVATIHTDVVAFFEDSAGLVLDIESRWRFPFSLAWRLLRPLMRAVGQFVLPLAGARIRVTTRVLALDGGADGRTASIAPRAAIRTYADDRGRGGVFQAVAYSTWERHGVRYMSAAFPQPLGQIAGFLRLDPLGEGAVVLTSSKREHRGGDDAGVWLIVGAGAAQVALPSPFHEQLSLWAPSTSNVPRELVLDAKRVDGATIVGRHEQRIFGVLFATHDYWFRPAGPAATTTATTTTTAERYDEPSR